MKGGFRKRSLAFILAVSMGIGLTACGEAGAKEEKIKRYFRTEYQENMPETFSSNVNAAIFEGDSVYYVAYNDAYTKKGIYSYNLLTAEEKVVWEEENTETEESKEPNYFAVDKDNNLYVYFNCNRVDEESLNVDYSQATFDDVINYMVESWNYDTAMAEEEWKTYFAKSYVNAEGNPDYEKFMKEMNVKYISTGMIEKIDANGNVVYTYETPVMDEGNVSCCGMAVDADGYAYACMNLWNDERVGDKYYIEVLDANGKSKGTVEFDSRLSKVFGLSDGSVACISYDNMETEMYTINKDKIEAGKPIAISAESMVPYDENYMLMSEGGTLYKYKLDDQSKEEYLNWGDCNISSSSVMNYGVLSDGTIAVYLNSWSSVTNQNSSDIAIIREVDENETAQVTNIDIACLGISYKIEEMAIEFNKKHEDYHINIKDYGNIMDEGGTEEEMMDAFLTAVASDTDVDIVVFNDYSDVTNFAEKGLMTDLYEFIDSDPVLKRDDFVPNVLSACEQDDKLVVLPTEFILNTVVGKVDDVGMKSGWTLEQMKELLASKPEGTQLFYGMTRERALKFCLCLGYNQYINKKDATCNFNSQDFMNVLEFANMFPSESESKEDVDDTVFINEGKVLLSQYYLNAVEQIQMYETVFGGDITHIGYPTTEGNGTMLCLSNMFSITKNCEAKDVAWKFLREIYLPKENTEEYVITLFGFSVRQDEFDYCCEKAMKEGELDGVPMFLGNFEIERKPATQKQVDAVKELVNNTTAINGMASQEMMNLIIEEASFYFSGEQSVENVAAKIQSRMEIYLSETK